MKTRTEIVGALDRFGSLDRAIVHPWWERKVVVGAPPGLKTTAYVVDERILLVVANWSDDRFMGEIELSLRELPLAGAKRVRDLERDRSGRIPFSDGRFRVAVPPRDFRLLVVDQVPEAPEVSETATTLRGLGS